MLLNYTMWVKRKGNMFEKKSFYPNRGKTRNISLEEYFLVDSSNEMGLLAHFGVQKVALKKCWNYSKFTCFTVYLLQKSRNSLNLIQFYSIF